MMRPDSFVALQMLQHGSSTYDPVKAREYYLKNRQLKGRQPGTVLDLIRDQHGAAKPAPAATKSRVVTAKPVVKAKAPVKNPAALRAKIGAITGKVSKMKKVLDDLLKKQKAEREAEAKKTKAKSSASSTSTTSKTSAGSSDSKEQKLTAQQKAEKAKDAKERYEKEKKPAKKDELKGAELDAKISEIRSVIKQAESELANAKKALAGS